MKLKGLLVELDEIRGQQESSGIQSDHVSSSFFLLHGTAGEKIKKFEERTASGRSNQHFLFLTSHVPQNW